MRNAALLLIICAVLAACSENEVNGTTDDTPPLELTQDLCDDPSNMAVLMDSLDSGSLPSFGETDEELIQSST